jgi:hypothetical protein
MAGSLRRFALSTMLLSMSLPALAAACGSDGSAQDAPPPSNLPQTPPATDPIKGVVLIWGDDVAPVVRERVRQYLVPVAGPDGVREFSKEQIPELGEGALAFAMGDTAVTRTVIPEVIDKPEGYRVRVAPSGKGTVVAGRGAPRKTHAFGNLGTHHAVYAALEHLGFGFLHPLRATRAAALTKPAPLDVVESPRWEERTMHLHTMHLTELTDFLQGWGPGGPNDKQGFDAQMPEWDSFLEWCVANGQNSAEWFLLWAKSWEAFADSPERMARMRTLVEHAHAFGISAGVDVPIAFEQQHSYRLLRKTGELADELAEIRTRLAFVMTGKFDFLGSEAGTSEFTHPSPDRMLAWMNELTREAEDKYGVHVFMKVHASTGQVAEGYPDPKTGQPINFNFLPHYADKRLGVLPHTVQHYGLTDPAPTYGNASFSAIRDFLHQEVPIRRTMFYPETAYWVSFDVDVPLFLPLYAERRVSDLRLLALDEQGKRAGASGQPMYGQLIFSSGWEWGYWLNDVIAARAAWNPHAEAPTDAAAFAAVLRPTLKAFGPAAQPLEQWLLKYADAEYRYLIHGERGGRRPTDVVKRNGQAYLQGWETWDDVAETSKALPVKLPPTQPDRLGLVEMRNPLHAPPAYTAEVDPLLTEMESAFLALLREGEALRAIPGVSDGARELIEEFVDAAHMTYLRARQVHGLYDYVDDFFNLTNRETRRRRLAEARAALDEAWQIARARERKYRVPADRIAGWRTNPTAYAYGYLWTVRSLHYFWRDEGKAVDAPAFPCYMNLVNPVQVAFGEGMGTDAARFFGGVLSSDDSRGCLAEPMAEPRYPQDNLRARP